MTETKPLRPEVAGRLPKRVVIVGQNESAWMTAASLSGLSGVAGCRITVLSSGEPCAEFTAETSQPSLAGFLSGLQKDEHAMMRACQATWQVATQFADWIQPERDTWKPFWPRYTSGESVSLFSAWFSERSQGRLLRPWHSYSLHWGVALAGKAPYGFSGPSPISQTASCAFQLDGRLFAEWLRAVSLEAGVEEVRGEISEVAQNGRGGIAQIRLSTGLAVAGDFFIDCTGAAGRLLRTELKQPFLGTTASSICNRVLSTRLPGRRQVPPFTRITALADGWTWQSPLATSIDSGFVFDSQRTDDETAWQQFRISADPDGLTSFEQIEPQFSSLETGRLQCFWKDNVLALGTAAWGVDPVANAGRHLTQMALENFLDRFPERNPHRAVIDEYNGRMTQAVDDVLDFAQLHYHLSKRVDSDFWRNASGHRLSDSLQTRLALYEASGSVGTLAAEAMPETAYLALLAGSGRLPSHPSLLASALDPTVVQKYLRELLKFNEAALKDLPLHEELLDWIHSRGSGLLRSA